MANEVVVTIKVNDDGTLKVVAKDAKKAAGSVDKVTKSTDKLNKSKEGLNVTQNKHNKLEKGTAQLGMNSTKAFSKQAQTLGGTLVPAYATLAANIFALTAAFGALQRAAAFEQLKQGLEVVGATAGQNLPYVAQQLRQITDFAITTQEAMRSVAMGVSAGFSTKQLEDLTKVAKGASLALGRNMEDAMSRLVRGTAKIEPEILDELGIMVRLDRAAEKYAAQLGKTATQLTQFERRQAFLNETIEQGLTKFSFVAESVDANPYDKLAATFGDLQKQIFKLLNTSLVPVMSLLATSPTALLGTMTVFAATIISKIVPGLNEAVAAQRKMADYAAQEAAIAKETAKARFTKLAEGAVASKVTPKSVTAAIDAQNFSTKQLQKNVQNLHRSEQIRANWIKTYQADTVKYSNVNIANKEKELAQIRREKAHYQEMLLVRQNLGKAGLSATVSEGKSLLANIRAQGFEKIGAAGAFGGFKEAFKATKEQLIGVKLIHDDVMKQMETASKGSTVVMGDAWESFRSRVSSTFSKFKVYFTSAIDSVKALALRIKGLTFSGVLASVKGFFTSLNSNLGLSFTSLTAFKASISGLKLNFTSLKVTALATLTSIKVGFIAAGGAAAFFGRALLNAIPVIGQLLLVFSLLAPLVSSLWKKGKVAEKTEEVVESLNNLTKVGYALEQSIVKADDSFDKFYNGLKASVGITDQVVSGLSSIQNAAFEVRSDKISKLTTRISELREEMATDWGWSPINALQLRSAKKELDELIQTRVELTAADAVPVLATTIAQLKSFGAKEMLQGLDKDLERVYERIQDGTITSYKEVMKAVEDSRSVYTKAFASIESAMDANAEYQKQMAKLSQKRITPIDELVKTVQNLSNEFETAAKAGEDSIGAFLKRVPEYQEAIIRKQEEMGFGTSITEAAVAYREELEAIQRVMLEYIGTMNQLKVLSQDLNKIRATNPEAAQKALDIERETLKTREEYLKAQIKVANAQAQSKLGEELKAVKAAQGILDVREEAGEVYVAQLNEQKRILEEQNKIIKAINNAELARVNTAYQLQKALAASQNRGLSPEEELQFARDKSNVVIDAAEKELQYANQRAEIETNIALQKIKFEKLQAERLNESLRESGSLISRLFKIDAIDTSEYDELMGLMKETLVYQQQLNVAKRDETLATEKANEAEKLKAKILRERLNELTKQKNEAERLNVLEVDHLSLQYKLNSVMGERIYLLRDMQNMEKGTQAYRIAALKLEELGIKELKARLDLLGAQESLILGRVESTKELNQAALDYNKILEKTNELQRRIFVAAGNRDFNAEDELKIFQAMADEREAQNKLDMTSTLDRIAVERALLEEKYALKIKEAQASGKSSAAIRELEYQLEIQRNLLDQRRKNTYATYEQKRAEEALNNELLKRAKYNAELDEKYRKRTVQANRLTMMEEEGLGSLKERANLYDQQLEIERQLRSVADNNLAKEQLSNELAQIKLDILNNRLSSYDLEKDRLLRILSLETEINKAVNERSLLIAATQTARAQAQASSTNRDFYAQDELQAFERIEAARREQNRIDKEAALARAKIEMDWISHRYDLLIAEARKDNRSDLVARLEQSKSLLAGVQKAQIAVAEAAYDEAEAQLDATKAAKERAAYLESLEAEYAAISNQATRLNILEQETESLLAEEVVLRDRLRVASEAYADSTGDAVVMQILLNNKTEAELEVLKNSLEIVKARRNEQLEQLVLQNQLIKATQDFIRAQKEIEVIGLRINAAIQDRDFNAEDELKAFKIISAERQRQNELDRQFSIDKIKAERAYLKDRYALLIAEAKLKPTANQSLIRELEGRAALLDEIAERQIKAVNATHAQKSAEEALKQSLLERAAIQARLDERWETRTILMDMLKEGSADIAALDVEALNLTEQKIVAEQRLNALKDGGLALTMAMNELFEAELALAKNRIAREKEVLEIYRLEADLIKEQYDTTLAIIKNQKVIANFLTGFGAALTPAQEYELQILAAEQALEMQRIETDLKVRELQIQKSITDLTILAAEASIKATRAKLEALKAEEGVDLGAITSQIADLDTLAATIESSRATALDQVQQQINLERQILKLKEQQAEQAIIAAKMSGPGGGLETSVAEKFGHEIGTAIINSMNSALSLFENVGEAIVANRAAPLEEEKQAKILEYDIKFEAGASIEELTLLDQEIIAIQENIDNINQAGLTIGETFKVGIAAATQALSPMIEQLRALGPEGEETAAIAEGILVISDAWFSAAEGIRNALAQVGEDGKVTFQGMMQAGVAAAQAISSTLSAIMSIQAASSRSRIAAIDREIEAEKKRDGQSAKSVAKINSLEKKKEAQKRKAFESNKKMMMAQTVVNTAAAIMTALATSGEIWTGIVMAALAAAMGAAQLAVISGTSYDGGGAGGISGPSKISVGERANTVDLAKSRSPSGELAYMRGESGYGTGASNYIPGAFTGRATGGNTAYMVGEQGPELFVPDRPGTILPSDDVQNIAPPVNVNFSINAIDTQGMTDALVQQRGNIISMIREAANSEGGFFLEDVNTLEEPV